MDQNEIILLDRWINDLNSMSDDELIYHGKVLSEFLAKKMNPGSSALVLEFIKRVKKE